MKPTPGLCPGFASLAPLRRFRASPALRKRSEVQVPARRSLGGRLISRPLGLASFTLWRVGVITFSLSVARNGVYYERLEVQ